MSLFLAYYNVSISQTLAAAPSDGFLDFLRPQDYIVDSGPDLETGWPTSLSNSLAKERAYLRWQTVIQQLETNVSPIAITATLAPSANVNTPPISFSFTIAYDRPDYLYAYDELNSNAIITGTLAVRRFVARALISTITRNVSILDPTLVLGPSAHYGESIQVITVGPLFTGAAALAAAEATITVAQVANTYNTGWTPTWSFT
jgi:hypothetical protein